MRVMIFKNVIIIIILLWPALTMSNDKIFWKKPVSTIMAFIDAVESSDLSYKKIIDFKKLNEKNIENTCSCSSDDLEGYFDELVMIPIKHKPSPNVEIVEKNVYTISEEIINYESALVHIEKNVNGERSIFCEFELLVIDGTWKIVNMNGYIEKYVFEACKKKQNEHR